ncbi:HTTM domain-containing protein [Halobacterium jilantaiense]|uniref:Vitamin K-dependent gamma-carboxylase n=1 Tax=Halobacterium jilantaiense TaxID=355548 RepID=A0A1I0N1C7_9EURY|nr:HTTM domain-containing protein [Halobacterium jilantaiense]SEV94615.1 Vitamin K-dependent gamma-carboxylase [Halobacterium jilantaiense]
MDVRAAVASRLGADTRSLAAFRVGVAGVVLLDLLLRSRYLGAFYTDTGVLPRDVLFAQNPVLGPLSLHALSGALWFQALLFAATAVAALALLVGYRTTLATLVTGLLVVSLHVRNPLVLNGGDLVLQMLFLWGLFLPLGERWSVDALREGPREKRVTSVATAGVLCQVVVIYATNAVLKLRGDAWLSGDAIQYVFSLEMFVHGVGHWLANYPALLVAFDTVWLAMLVGSGLLLLVTGWPRALLAAAYAAMHVGMAATMQLGVFPLVAVVALVPFIPSVVWDALADRPHRPVVAGPRVARVQEALRARLPLVSTPSLPPDALDWGRRALTVALAAFLVAQLAYSAASVGLVPVPDAGPLDGEEPEARWNMFAPEPLSVDIWVKAPAATPNGDLVDAFHGGEFTWDKPPDVSKTYPSARWRKYVMNVVDADDQSVREGFAASLCSRSPHGRSASVTNASVYSVEQPTRLDGPEPTNRVALAATNCST